MAALRLCCLSSHMALPHTPPLAAEATAAAGAKKKTVVVTGACGFVASMMLPQLRERYNVVALDVTQPRTREQRRQEGRQERPKAIGRERPKAIGQERYY